MATKQLLARFNGLTRRGFSHAAARAEARNGKGVKTPWRKEGTSPFTTAEAVAYYTPQRSARKTPRTSGAGPGGGTAGPGANGYPTWAVHTGLFT